MRLRYLLISAALLLSSAAGAIGAFDPSPFLPVAEYAANVFGSRLSTLGLKQKHHKEVIPILIVPGHDNSSIGTSFGGLRETDLNLVLGYHLYNFFKDDPWFSPIITRGPDGEHHPWLERYLFEKREEIALFRTQSRLRMRHYEGAGFVEYADNAVRHNPAADNVSRGLYGINKWANENEIPIVLHIHFNDYPRRRMWRAGEYSGFAIYIPEDALPNAHVSRVLAEAVKERLEKRITPSTFPRESEIIIPDRELIAVGSNASRDGASLLIEYGYVYEPHIQRAATRGALLREYAFQTYAGIKDFFGDKFVDTEFLPATTLLPHKWQVPALSIGTSGEDTLALQEALRQEGVYPPAGKTLSSCPLSGYYGRCTARAVSDFQEKYRADILTPIGYSRGTGSAGPMTLKILNALY